MTVSFFETLALTILLGIVAHRVARFWIMDTLAASARQSVSGFIVQRAIRCGGWTGDIPILRVLAVPWGRRWFWLKLDYMLACPYCLTIWAAAGATVLTDWRTSVPLPVWVWLGASTISLLSWRALDGDDEPEEE